MSRNKGPLLRAVDAVMIPVPDLDRGLAVYRDHLGHELIWRNDDIGQAGLRLPDGETELVLCTDVEYGPTWLVHDITEAVTRMTDAGGTVVQSRDIPVGRLAVVDDPFGNRLVLLDLSAGRYVTDADGRVTGVGPAATGWRHVPVLRRRS